MTRTKANVLKQLNDVLAIYVDLQDSLHPSLDLYTEIKDYKMAVLDLISDLEAGKYDKVS